jgi:molybdopterin synthase catalytic subunit
VYLSLAPLELPVLLSQVAGPGFGAVATFVGLVRDHHAGRSVIHLEYSAYAEMAEARCAAIVAEAETDGVRVALAHRLGVLEIGEAAVMVVVASAHREAAFATCRAVIERVKAEVPIWKRERYADGSESWVDPTAPDGIHPTGGTA